MGNANSNENYCKRYANARTETVDVEHNRYGPWETYYESQRNPLYKNPPPEPPKPTYPSLTSICQDCRSYNVGNEITDSKSVALEQVNTCIAGMEKSAADKASADKIAADKAAADKIAADKAAADKAASDKIAAENSSQSKTNMIKYGGIIGGSLSITIVIIIIIIMIMRSSNSS